MKKLFIGWLFTLIAGQSLAACYGKITNPVTDVCWECVFPITVGQNTSLISASGFTDVTTDADSLCSCMGEADITLGMNIGFWEPIRTIEIVREPFCFPSLGGITMGGRFSAPAHGRTLRCATGRMPCGPPSGSAPGPRKKATRRPATCHSAGSGRKTPSTSVSAAAGSSPAAESGPPTVKTVAKGVVRYS